MHMPANYKLFPQMDKTVKVSLCIPSPGEHLRADEHLVDDKTNVTSVINIIIVECL